MSIDITTEQVHPLTEVARRLPARRAGKRTHVSCLWRWVTAGLRGVQLESIRVGGVTCTSMAAVQRFFNALTDQRVSPASRKLSTAAEIERRRKVSREVDGALRPPSARSAATAGKVGT